tara:strand:- start:62 stop:211 length:150 start_codon:yes stop_codon:yes gene_type:complete
MKQEIVSKNTNFLIYEIVKDFANLHLKKCIVQRNKDYEEYFQNFIKSDP